MYFDVIQINDATCMQHTATCWSTNSNHTATHCNTSGFHHMVTSPPPVQQIATQCNTMQNTVIHCNALQITATRMARITLQHIATLSLIWWFARIQQ